jgi:hypothetical protein
MKRAMAKIFNRFYALYIIMYIDGLFFAVICEMIFFLPRLASKPNKQKRLYSYFMKVYVIILAYFLCNVKHYYIKMCLKFRF